MTVGEGYRGPTRFSADSYSGSASWRTSSFRCLKSNESEQSASVRLTHCIVTTPEERTRAVVHTREFLQGLLDPSVTARVPAVVREEARRLLRHYPSAGDMSLAHDALPSWFGEPPTTVGKGEGKVFD